MSDNVRDAMFKIYTADAYCDCCERTVPAGEWDGLYGSCDKCAVEASLYAFPCNHGEEEGT